MYFLDNVSNNDGVFFCFQQCQFKKSIGFDEMLWMIFACLFFEPYECFLNDLIFFINDSIECKDKTRPI